MWKKLENWQQKWKAWGNVKGTVKHLDNGTEKQKWRTDQLQDWGKDCELHLDYFS